MTIEMSEYVSKHGREINIVDATLHLFLFFYIIGFWNKADDNIPNKFEILDKGEWISLSDHLPLVFKFD